ncbi:MAG: metal-dependent hydrolase [Chthoniobacterales bacterium]|nr:metal-dependent hydrolase [Chthoniobacterales bacterium]
MNFTYYGHSCFQIDVAGKKLLFDPFITPNPLASGVDITQLKPDYIFLSHGHYDHVADVERIASQSEAVIVGCYEVVEWFRAKGFEKNHSMNIGGSWEFDFGKVTLTPAVHSSSMPDGSYGGVAGGFLIKTEEGFFYYSGDTALFSDMKLLASKGALAFAVLCIGGNFTMNAKEALQGAQWLGCKEIIGVHYDTFPAIKINHTAAQNRFQKEGSQLHLLPIGESLSFS